MDFSSFEPRKSLGQHFLVDQNVAEKIVSSLKLRPHDHVLEIGPGRGSLTRLIVPQVEKIIAVELDQRLIPSLRCQIGDVSHFQLINADFLSLEIDTLGNADKKLRIVGNIPYNISSPVIFKVVDSQHVVHDMTLMLQREVARRVVASHGNKDYGILSVINQAYAHTQILFDVSRKVFNPVPNVDSAIVHWQFGTGFGNEIRDHVVFRQLVRTAFNQRRKMLRNSVKNLIADIKNCPISLDRRPEQLSIREWVDFSNELLNK